MCMGILHCRARAYDLVRRKEPKLMVGAPRPARGRANEVCLSALVEDPGTYGSGFRVFFDPEHHAKTDGRRDSPDPTGGE